MYINESFTPFITLDNTEENLEFITKNSTNEDYAEIVIAVFTSIILGLMILVTVIGTSNYNNNITNSLLGCHH